MFRSLFFGGLAMFAAALLVLAWPAIVVLAIAAPAFGLRRYSMAGVASAQIQAVGLSLQIGSRIWGAAPKSWWSPGRGIDKRSLWPSCLQIRLLAADYSCGARTAFGVSLGSLRLSLRTTGVFGASVSDPSELGWMLWRRSLRC